MVRTEGSHLVKVVIAKGQLQQPLTPTCLATSTFLNTLDCLEYNPQPSLIHLEQWTGEVTSNPQQNFGASLEFRQIGLVLRNLVKVPVVLQVLHLVDNPNTLE